MFNTMFPLSWSLASPLDDSVAAFLSAPSTSQGSSILVCGMPILFTCTNICFVGVITQLLSYQPRGYVASLFIPSLHTHTLLVIPEASIDEDPRWISFRALVERRGVVAQIVDDDNVGLSPGTQHCNPIPESLNLTQYSRPMLFTCCLYS